MIIITVANIKLNHVNLPVTDVAASSGFFERYFNFKCTGIKSYNRLAVLEGIDGFILELTAYTFNRNGNNNYPDAFHIGFLLGGHEQVAEIYGHLKENGINVPLSTDSLRGGYGVLF